MPKIAVVVPTIRYETKFLDFLGVWEELFEKHKVELVVVLDGDIPVISHRSYEDSFYRYGWDASDILDEDKALILHHTASVRNLGFAYVQRFLPEVEVILSLDDDLKPVNDPIQDHLDALNRNVPVSWMSTLVDFYPRGFPYGVREEAEVVLSHGVWEGVLDLDAPTQLVYGTEKKAAFYRGPIPKFVHVPLSSMNIAFKRKALPYIFHAPMNLQTWGMDRFDDIWGLLDGKLEMDSLGWATVSGYSIVYHERASDPFVNLTKEAKGLVFNERYWQDGMFEDNEPYFIWYLEARKRWKKWCEKYE